MARVEEAATETVTPSEEVVGVQEGEKEQGDEEGKEVMASDAAVQKETQDQAQAGVRNRPITNIHPIFIL